MLRTKCSIDDLKRLVNCLEGYDWLPTLQKHQSIIETESDLNKLTDLFFTAITKLSQYYSGSRTFGVCNTHEPINQLYDIYQNRLQKMIKGYDHFDNFVKEFDKARGDNHNVSVDWIVPSLLKRISIVQTPEHLVDLLNKIHPMTRTEVINIVHSHWEIEYRRTCRMILLQSSKDSGSSLFKLFHNQYSLGCNTRGIEAGVIKKIFDYANLGPYKNSGNGVGEKGYSLKPRR